MNPRGLEKRPSLLACALLAAALSSSGCESVKKLQVVAVTGEQVPFRLCVLPTDELVGLKVRYLPLAQYLGTKLHRQAELVVGPEYDSVGALLEQGKVDLGWFSGNSFLRSSQRHHLVPLARALLNGQSQYRGVIIVRTDSPIRSLAELKGKRFAYVDRDSGSGFLAPNRTLLRAGIDPLSDLASITFTHAHFASAKGVIEGRYDAAAVYENCLESFRDRIDASKLRVLVQTDSVPKDVAACSEAMPVEERETIWKLLSDLPSTAEGREILRQLERSNPIDGFARP